MPLEPAKIQRESGTYVVEGTSPSFMPVRLTFPPTFDVEAMRNVTVDAVVFAERQREDYPLWCVFKHPGDGMWRSVFAQREWTVAREGADIVLPPPHRIPPKRPR